MIGERIFPRNLSKSTIPTKLTTSGNNIPIKPGGIIGPHNHLPTIANAHGAGIDGGIGADIGDAGVTDGGILALVVAADEGGAATGIAGDIDLAGIQQAHLFTQHLHGAALLAAVIALGSQGAAVGDDAGVAADQADGAAAGVNGVGLDDALVVDHLGKDILGGMAGEQHLAAVGSDAAGIGHGAGDVAGVFQHLAADRETEQTVPVEIKGGHLAAGQVHRAQGGDDVAFVEHAAADQRNTAAGGSGNQPTVDDGAAGGEIRATQGPCAAQHEIGDAGVQGGGKKTADIDGGAFAKDYPVGIGEENAAIGLDRAKDLAGVLVEDAVEHRS